MDSRTYLPLLPELQRFQSYAQYDFQAELEQPLVPQPCTHGATGALFAANAYHAGSIDHGPEPGTISIQPLAQAIQIHDSRETSHNMPSVDYKQLMQPLPPTSAHVPKRNTSIDFTQLQRKAPKAARVKQSSNPRRMLSMSYDRNTTNNAHISQSNMCARGDKITHKHDVSSFKPDSISTKLFKRNSKDNHKCNAIPPWLQHRISSPMCQQQP